MLEDGDSPLIPSVVSFHPNGEVLVGNVARDRRMVDAKNTVFSVKRLIGRPFDAPEVARAQQRLPFELQPGPTNGVQVVARDETYTLSEISAFVLRKVRAVAEAELKRPCTRAVVTVPANFNELQRSATKAAGRVAGLEVLRILNEPTAAALAYGYGNAKRERVAIYDFGGGTFDITILELAGEVFEVLATAGDTFLGGDDIDTLVASQMAKAFLKHHQYDAKDDVESYERLRAAAEWAKCQLSAKESVQLRIEELGYGADGASLDLTFALTRSTLEKMTRPLIQKTLDVCEESMKIAGVKVSELDKVILVGGSTRMPLVRTMVSSYFGQKPLSDIDPDLVVAKGAAIQARSLATARAPTSLGRVPLKKKAAISVSPKKQAIAEESDGLRPVDDDDDYFEPTDGNAKALLGLLADREDEHTVAGASPYDGPTTGRRSAISEQAMLAVSAMDLPSPMDMEAADPAETNVVEPPAALPPIPPRSSVPPPPPPQPARAAAPPPLPPIPGTPAIPVDSAPPLSSLVGAKSAKSPSPNLASTLQGGFTVDQLPGLPSAPPAAPAAPPPLPPGPAATPDFGDPPPPPGPRSAPPTIGQVAPGGAAFAASMGNALEALGVAPEGRPPLLLDVTPLSLGVETVDGYCESIIDRNSSIPIEQSRVFTTGRDEQQSVIVQICQGESRRIGENQMLGELQLDELRSAARGEVKINVTFVIDADGTLAVSAKDLETGRQQAIQIKLIGEVPASQLPQMEQRTEAMFAG